MRTFATLCVVSMMAAGCADSGQTSYASSADTTNVACGADGSACGDLAVVTRADAVEPDPTLGALAVRVIWGLW